jgi:hypothetical protein
MIKEKVFTSHQTHPLDLATSNALKLECQQPADGQPVAALFKLRMRDQEHLCGLYCWA